MIRRQMISQGQRPITQEEWAEWKEHPITRKFFDFLQREAAGQRDLVALGGCKIMDSQIIDFNKTGIAYTYRILLAEVYENMSDIALEDIIDEDNTSRA